MDIFYSNTPGGAAASRVSAYPGAAQLQHTRKARQQGQKTLRDQFEETVERLSKENRELLRKTVEDIKIHAREMNQIRAAGDEGGHEEGGKTGGGGKAIRKGKTSYTRVQHQHDQHVLETVNREGAHAAPGGSSSDTNGNASDEQIASSNGTKSSGTNNEHASTGGSCESGSGAGAEGGVEGGVDSTGGAEPRPETSSGDEDDGVGGQQKTTNGTSKGSVNNKKGGKGGNQEGTTEERLIYLGFSSPAKKRVVRKRKLTSKRDLVNIPVGLTPELLANAAQILEKVENLEDVVDASLLDPKLRGSRQPLEDLLSLERNSRAGWRPKDLARRSLGNASSASSCTTAGPSSSASSSSSSSADAGGSKRKGAAGNYVYPSAGDDSRKKRGQKLPASLKDTTFVDDNEGNSASVDESASSSASRSSSTAAGMNVVSKAECRLHKSSSNKASGAGLSQRQSAGLGVGKRGGSRNTSALEAQPSTNFDYLVNFASSASVQISSEKSGDNNTPVDDVERDHDDEHGIVEDTALSPGGVVGGGVVGGGHNFSAAKTVAFSRGLPDEVEEVGQQHTSKNTRGSSAKKSSSTNSPEKGKASSSPKARRTNSSVAPIIASSAEEDDVIPLRPKGQVPRLSTELPPDFDGDWARRREKEREAERLAEEQVAKAKLEMAENAELQAKMNLRPPVVRGHNGPTVLGGGASSASSSKTSIGVGGGGSTSVGGGARREYRGAASEHFSCSDTEGGGQGGDPQGEYQFGHPKITDSMLTNAYLMARLQAKAKQPPGKRAVIPRPKSSPPTGSDNEDYCGSRAGSRPTSKKGRSSSRSESRKGSRSKAAGTSGASGKKKQRPDSHRPTSSHGVGGPDGAGLFGGNDGSSSTSHGQHASSASTSKSKRAGGPLLGSGLVGGNTANGNYGGTMQQAREARHRHSSVTTELMDAANRAPVFMIDVNLPANKEQAKASTKLKSSNAKSGSRPRGDSDASCNTNGVADEAGGGRGVENGNNGINGQEAAANDDTVSNVSSEMQWSCNSSDIDLDEARKYAKVSAKVDTGLRGRTKFGKGIPGASPRLPSGSPRFSSTTGAGNYTSGQRPPSGSPRIAGAALFPHSSPRVGDAGAPPHTSPTGSMRSGGSGGTGAPERRPQVAQSSAANDRLTGPGSVAAIRAARIGGGGDAGTTEGGVGVDRPPSGVAGSSTAVVRATSANRHSGGRAASASRNGKRQKAESAERGEERTTRHLAAIDDVTTVRPASSSKVKSKHKEVEENAGELSDEELKESLGGFYAQKNRGNNADAQESGDEEQGEDDGRASRRRSKSRSAGLKKGPGSRPRAGDGATTSASGNANAASSGANVPSKGTRSFNLKEPVDTNKAVVVGAAAAAASRQHGHGAGNDTFPIGATPASGLPSSPIATMPVGGSGKQASKTIRPPLPPGVAPPLPPGVAPPGENFPDEHPPVIMPKKLGTNPLGPLMEALADSSAARRKKTRGGGLAQQLSPLTSQRGHQGLGRSGSKNNNIFQQEDQLDANGKKDPDPNAPRRTRPGSRGRGEDTGKVRMISMKESLRQQEAMSPGRKTTDELMEEVVEAASRNSMAHKDAKIMPARASMTNGFQAANAFSPEKSIGHEHFFASDYSGGGLHSHQAETAKVAKARRRMEQQQHNQSSHSSASESASGAGSSSEEEEDGKRKEAKELLATWRKMQKEKPFQVANLRWGGNRGKQSQGYKKLMEKNDFATRAKAAADLENSRLAMAGNMHASSSLVDKHCGTSSALGKAALSMLAVDAASKGTNIPAGVNVSLVEAIALGADPLPHHMLPNGKPKKGHHAAQGSATHQILGPGGTYWKLQRRPSSGMKHGGRGSGDRPRSSGDSPMAPPRKKKKKKLSSKHPTRPLADIPDSDMVIPVGLTDAVSPGGQLHFGGGPGDVESADGGEEDEGATTIPVEEAEVATNMAPNHHHRSPSHHRGERRSSGSRGSSRPASGNDNSASHRRKVRAPSTPPPLFSMPNCELNEDGLITFPGGDSSVLFEQNPHLSEAGHVVDAEEGERQDGVEGGGGGGKKKKRKNSMSTTSTATTTGERHPLAALTAMVQEEASKQNRDRVNAAGVRGRFFDAFGNVVEGPPEPVDPMQRRRDLIYRREGEPDLRKVLGRKMSRSSLAASLVVPNGSGAHAGLENPDAPAPLSLEAAAEEVETRLEAGGKAAMEKQQQQHNSSKNSSETRRRRRSSEGPFPFGPPLVPPDDGIMPGDQHWISNAQNMMNEPGPVQPPVMNHAEEVQQAGTNPVDARSPSKQDQANLGNSFLFYDGSPQAQRQMEQQMTQQQMQTQSLAGQPSIETVPSIFVVPDERWEPKSSKLQKKMEKKKRERQKIKMLAEQDDGKKTASTSMRNFRCHSGNVKTAEHEGFSAAVFPDTNEAEGIFAEEGGEGGNADVDESSPTKDATGSSSGRSSNKKKNSKVSAAGNKKSVNKKNSPPSVAISSAHPPAKPPEYLDQAMAYGLDLYRVLRDSTNDDLGSWCLCNPMVAQNSHIYLLGQLHYSKWDAVHMARVFRHLQPHIVGLESPLDGRETWRGLAEAFRRESGKEDCGLRFLNDIGKKARKESKNGGKQNVDGQKSIVSICNSFPVAMPKHLADESSARIFHIDGDRQLALQACSLLKQQSMSHYLRLVCDLPDAEIDRYCGTNGAPTMSAEEIQNAVAELSFEVVPTHRLAFVLREVALRTEPQKTSDIIFHQRERGMAATLCGFEGRILAVVGCQHIPGLVQELRNFGYKGGGATTGG
ncbi:unnamed protein product [Amoebophrya sp. A25]|nr:unnamed protein product [Amoebophrya sp. A25]|eukprot:GSA25T00021159001.1